MENKRFSAISIIKDTFASAGKLYLPVFIIGLPGLIFSLIGSTSNLDISLMTTLNIAYVFLISPWVTGTTAFYSYQNLIGSNTSINYAFQRSAKQIPNLIVATILFSLIITLGLILLIIPGFYLLYRLSLSVSIVAIEDCSAIEGIKRSWELTKGHWWFVFSLSFLLGLPFLVIVILTTPIFLVSELLGEVFFTLGIFALVPLMGIAFTLLYMRLKGETKLVLDK